MRHGKRSDVLKHRAQLHGSFATSGSLAGSFGIKIPTEKGDPTLAIIGSPIPVASVRPHLMRFKHRRRETVVCVLIAKATVEP